MKKVQNKDRKLALVTDTVRKLQSTDLAVVKGGDGPIIAGTGNPTSSVG